MSVDGRSVDVQYSNWTSGSPLATSDDCVAVTLNNDWIMWRTCSYSTKYICQS